MQKSSKPDSLDEKQTLVPPPTLRRVSNSEEFAIPEPAVISAQGDMFRSLAVHSAQPVQFGAFLPLSAPSNHWNLDLTSLEFAAPLDSSVEETGEVQEVPQFCVSRTTSFLSYAVPRDLFHNLKTILSADSTVECTAVRPDRNQIKGVVVRENEMMTFAVQIFREKQGYLVEFQRRSGDCWAFNRFFHETANKLSPVVAEKYSQCLNAQPPMDLSLEPTVLNGVECDPFKLTADSVCNMAQSDKVDTVQTGMRALVDLCSKPELQAKFLESHQQVLYAVVQHALGFLFDHEVARCTATLISLLSHDSDVQSLLAAHMLEQMFDIFKGATHLMETRRQIAAALKNVSSQHPQSFLKDKYLETLWSAVQSPDSQLRAAATSVLSRVTLLA